MAIYSAYLATSQATHRYLFFEEIRLGSKQRRLLRTFVLTWDSALECGTMIDGEAITIHNNHVTLSRLW